MPKGVPFRVQVAGRGMRTYTLTEIAAGSGLSLPLVSLIFGRRRRITPYAAERLASFFQISIEELFTEGTFNIQTPAPRPLGRMVGRIHPGSSYRPPVLDRDAQARLLETLQREPCPLFPRGQ